MAPRTNDACLRAALKARLSRRHVREDDVFIVEELPSRRASGRLDVAVVNGHLHGFEIKSDLDTLERLPRQVGAFGPAMQQMTLVAAERHVAAALGIIPGWWGLMSATLGRDGSVRLATVRKGLRNRNLMPRAVAELLERDELLTLLHRHGADAGVRTANYDAVVDRTIARIGNRALLDGVREALKFRAAWEAAETLTVFGRTAILLNAVPRPVSAAPSVSCAGSS